MTHAIAQKIQGQMKPSHVTPSGLTITLISHHGIDQNNRLKSVDDAIVDTGLSGNRALGRAI